MAGFRVGTFKVGAIALDICILITTAAIVVLGILALLIFKSNHYKFNIVQDNFNNWLLSPIDDITVAVNSQCPAGYTVNLFKAPDTVEGCACSAADSTALNLFRGKCDGNQTQGNYFTNKTLCEKVDPVSGLYYSRWQGVEMCVKRSNYNYFNIPVLAGNTTLCPTGFKACGRIDTLSNFLCLPTNQACPVNKILFFNNSTSLPTDFNYTRVNLSPTNFILFTNQAVNNPIPVEFKVSDLRPCSDPNFANNVGTTYALDHYFGTGVACGNSLGGTFFDTRYTLLDSTDNVSLLRQNGLYYVFANLPLFDVGTLTKTTSLWSRPYIGLDAGSCYAGARGNITNNGGFSQLQINSRFLLLDKIQDVLKAVFAMAILTGCVILFIYFLMKTLINCYIINSFSAAIMVDIITCLVLLGYFIACAIAASKINTFRIWYNNFVPDKYCGDIIQNDTYKPIKRLLSNLLAFTLVPAILAPILAILVFLDLLMFNKGGAVTERDRTVPVGHVDQFRAVDTNPDVVRTQI